jgi:hypothetical protein
MSISSGFFKAKNREVAQSEIISRLGGDSEITSFLTDYILNIAKGDSRMKKFPMAIFVHESKPQFSLSDGEMLDGYAVDINSKKEVASRYMGSGDTTYLHQKEQLSEGMKTPEHIIAIFVTRIPSQGKLAWTVDVVGNIQKQVERKPETLETKECQFLDALKKVFRDYSEKSFSYSIEPEKTTVEFYRKVEATQFSDVEYYLGQLDLQQPLKPASNWNYGVFKREDAILIRFENLKENLTIKDFREVEYKIEEIDSDLRRVKRSSK